MPLANVRRSINDPRAENSVTVCPFKLPVSRSLRHCRFVEAGTARGIPPNSESPTRSHGLTFHRSPLSQALGQWAARGRPGPGHGARRSVHGTQAGSASGHGARRGPGLRRTLSGSGTRDQGPAPGLARPGGGATASGSPCQWPRCHHRLDFPGRM